MDLGVYSENSVDNFIKGIGKYESAILAIKS